jgi:hypothetical protein
MAAWRDQVTDEILNGVRAQQRTGWREVHQTLVQGAAAFATIESGDDRPVCSE